MSWYKDYNPTHNIKRKMGRTGDRFEDAGPNKASHVYTSAAMGTAKVQATREAKAAQAASRKNPIKEIKGEAAAAFGYKPPSSKKLIKIAANGQWSLKDE